MGEGEKVAALQKRLEQKLERQQHEIERTRDAIKYLGETPVRIRLLQRQENLAWDTQEELNKLSQQLDLLGY